MLYFRDKELYKIPGFHPGTRNPEPKTNLARNPEFKIFAPKPGKNPAGARPLFKIPSKSQCRSGNLEFRDRGLGLSFEIL